MAFGIRCGSYFLAPWSDKVTHFPTVITIIMIRKTMMILHDNHASIFQDWDACNPERGATGKIHNRYLHLHLLLILDGLRKSCQREPWPFRERWRFWERRPDVQNESEGPQPWGGCWGEIRHKWSWIYFFSVHWTWLIINQSWKEWGIMLSYDLDHSHSFNDHEPFFQCHRHDHWAIMIRMGFDALQSYWLSSIFVVMDVIIFNHDKHDDDTFVGCPMERSGCLWLSHRKLWQGL